jgi:hypothetical protein
MVLTAAALATFRYVRAGGHRLAANRSSGVDIDCPLPIPTVHALPPMGHIRQRWPADTTVA